MDYIYKRNDRTILLSAHELPNNDVIDWAIYTRIDKTVLRINAININTGFINFDYVTSTDIIPNENNLRYELSNLLQEYTNKNKDYKIINFGG